MEQVHILYNDRCPVCRAEIAHYRDKAQAAGAALHFDDLNTTDLGAWRLTPDQAARRMHAKLPDGTVVSGVPAFVLIWNRLPRMGWLARLVQLPLIGGVARFAYDRIAAPWLYHRHRRRETLDASNAQS